jgi:GNAT superfamily N-acetyltransferase
MPTTTRSELERLRGVRRAQLERVSSRAEPFAHGTAFFTPEHALKWDLNLLLVDRVPPGLGAQELMTDADRLQGRAGLRHRKLELAEGGEHLRTDFEAAGWSVDHLLLMLLRRGADRRGATAPVSVREVGHDAVRPLAERWHSELLSSGSATELTEADAAAARLLSARSFLAERDGAPAAYALLLDDGDGVGEVDQVYAAPEHRGAGLASAVVRAAAGASLERGDELTFLVADAEDWPRVLYDRLGFEMVGTRFEFTRKPLTT